MTDFTDNFALGTLIFIFAVYCLEQFLLSRFVQKLWNQACKKNVVIQSQRMYNKWARKVGFHTVSLSTQNTPKNKIIAGDVESQPGSEASSPVPPNKSNKAFFGDSPLTQRRTPQSQRSKKKEKTPKTVQSKKGKSGPISKNKLNLESVNTYDLFKLVSTLAMFVDHYGYMGLPLRTRYYSIPSQHWLRIYGRFAAPGFFFLCGFSSKRFRMNVWMGALFLYWFTVEHYLDIVWVPFESILCVAAINLIYKYLPPNIVLKNWLASACVLYGMHHYSDWVSKNLHVGYGLLPFMFAIAGDMVRHKKGLLSVLWVFGTCASFAYYSIQIFSRTEEQSKWIIGESFINGLLMVSFSIKPVAFFDKLPQPLLSIVRDGIKWLSRNGLIVYIGHLMLYRLIRQTARLPPSVRH